MAFGLSGGIYAAGSDFSGKALDVTAPEFSSAVVATDGDSITVVFDEDTVVGSGGGNGMVVTSSGGAVTLTYSSGTGTSDIVYATSRTIDYNETLSNLSYTQPGDGLEDAAGNDVATFSGEAVTNRSAINAPLSGGSSASLILLLS